ncbi:hypothetical protein HYW46_00720 [Candidatus Daviesbacteria bacterium]|nr:hypothetical protein [Candidatus Daviesbacteria bacterium]
MDERAKVLLVTGSVLLILLAIISGTILYFVKGFGGRQTATLQKQSDSPKPAASGFDAKPPSPSPQTPAKPGEITSSGMKSYKGEGFEIFYPKNWGLLTCSNSKNIELDPLNSADFKDVVCGRAQKPITILVGNNAKCQGTEVDLGGKKVIRSKISITGYTKYQWCAPTLLLDITHRVSSDNSPASSKDDYSSKVEEMISGIHFGQGS